MDDLLLNRCFIGYKRRDNKMPWGIRTLTNINSNYEKAFQDGDSNFFILCWIAMRF